MATTSYAGKRTGVTVSLPTVMLSATGGRRQIVLCPGTVEQALNGLIEQFPNLLPRLLTEQKQIHRFVNVYVDNEDIRFLEGLDTRVLDGQQLTILSAIAGG
jgi:molybdopterin synthase sulfur carrier subunit